MKTEPFTGKSPEMKKPTPWLASEDLLDAGDVKVTISGVFKHKDAKFDDGRVETVFALAFAGKERQLVLNATNRKTLVDKFETTDVKAWIGKEIVLYVDRDVRKPGGGKSERCCGIRIRR
jgi:hypothetical protein